MKLANKITLAYVSLAFLVLAVNGVVRVHREHELFETEAQRDHQLLARSIGSAVQRTWEREGADAALALIARGQADVTNVKLRWVWLDVPGGHTDAPGGGAKIPAHENELHSILEPRPDGPAVLRTYLPLQLQGRIGALEIAESMTDREAYIRTGIRNNLLGSAALALLFSLAAIWTGRRLLGAPLAQLTELSRRIGQGELEARTELARGDEIGDLARQMNAMGESLATARMKLKEETQQKLSALEQLRQADRLSTVGQLATGVAHELGTPLNVVLGRAKMIASGAVKEQEAREAAAIVMDQVRSMTAIIRSLLDFARPRPPIRDFSDLATVAEHTVNLLRPLAEKRHIRLEVEKVPAPVRARVDAGQVQQVLTNLVMNAVHASGSGGRVGVSLSALEAPHPDRADGPLAPWARVQVSDEGSGIAPEVLEHIFEPFFTTKPVGEGTGLGLSVSHRLVHEQGGWIDVKSEPGRGTKFSVFLPAGAA